MTDGGQSVLNPDLKSVALQILLAVLASSFIVTIFTTAYSDYFKKPYITTDVSRDKTADPRNYTISVMNNGLDSATNLRLTIVTPAAIKNYTYFGTENLTLKQSGPNMLTGNIQKFVQGPGDYIRIHTMIDAKSSILDYATYFVVYSDYDQGSNTSTEPIDPVHKIIFAANYNYFLDGFIIILLIITVLITMALLYYKHYRTLSGILAVLVIIIIIGFFGLEYQHASPTRCDIPACPLN